MIETPGRLTLMTRVRTLPHRHRLDLELAAGSDPNVDPLRRERARELLSEGSRRKLAWSLERLLAEADSPPPPLSPRVPIARDAIREQSSAVETIVERLKAPSYVSPQGVAMVSLLLADGAGPLYRGNSENAQGLGKDLDAAVDAIDHGPGLAG